MKNRKIKITEAKYKQANRDRKRLVEIKRSLKPINDILKNVK